MYMTAQVQKMDKWNMYFVGKQGTWTIEAAGSARRRMRGAREVNVR